MKQGEHAQHHALLELFAYGNWSDYKGSTREVVHGLPHRAVYTTITTHHTANQQHLPSLTDTQIAKLKQLTVVSLATTQKVCAWIPLMMMLCVHTHASTGHHSTLCCLC